MFIVTVGTCAPFMMVTLVLMEMASSQLTMPDFISLMPSTPRTAWRIICSTALTAMRVLPASLESTVMKPRSPRFPSLERMMMTLATAKIA